MPDTVLIVDDDPVQRRLIESMVQRFGYQPLTAEGGDAAVALLLGPAPARIDCVVLDLVMPDLDGLGVLARMREAGLDTPVIVQTAHGGIDNVVSAMRAGASDFVVKPASPERLQVSLANALNVRRLAGELQRIKRSRDGTLSLTDVVTRSPAMQPVLRAIEKASASTIPVLVEGESGVGKELIARAIHGTGARRAKPFVAVNCGALPENLVESILFGHEKGALTGATEKHTGKFIEADGGTLFLDEVGELPPAAQVKLLRALQEGEIRRLGDSQDTKVDVRVVAATARNLTEEVKRGTFREDLYYRINVFALHLSPLRQRREDIPLLVEHFLARMNARMGLAIAGVTAEASRILMAYDWPGNVRELENTVERAVVLTNGPEIDADSLPERLRVSAPVTPAVQIVADDGDLSIKRASRRSEESLIRRALERTRGNRTRAAELLEISHRALLYKIREYGIVSARDTRDYDAYGNRGEPTPTPTIPTPTDSTWKAK